MKQEFLYELMKKLSISSICIHNNTVGFIEILKETKKNSIGIRTDFLPRLPRKFTGST